MTAIFLLLLLLALLTLVVSLVVGGAPLKASADEEELSRQIQRVDLDAFRNLTDPDEQEYLRAKLPASEFRSLERLRSRAAIDYLLGVSHNAALLLHFGQTARRSADQRVVEAARNLIDDALRLRLLSILAIAKLSIRIVFPGAVLRPAGIVDRYQRMSDGAAQLGRLQYPHRGALLSRSL